MVWGTFAGEGTCVLQTIQGTLNTDQYIQILTDNLLPLDLPGRGFTFQQDNATPHTSRHTCQFLHANGVEVMQWPQQSPDLNPIENLSDSPRAIISRSVERNHWTGFCQTVSLQNWNPCIFEYLGNFNTECSSTAD